jgi:hypothetical protein
LTCAPAAAIFLPFLLRRALLVYHKASLVATRDFWRLLTRDVIPMERLGHSFKRIDEMELMAQKTYKLVLDRYPTNAKMLKSYGKFLENVKVGSLGPRSPPLLCTCT